jgi:hypothetical protein
MNRPRRPIDDAVCHVRYAEMSRDPGEIAFARRLVAKAGATSPVADLVARLERVVPTTPDERRRSALALAAIQSVAGLAP